MKSAYRTIFERAALAMVSAPPIDLLIREKQEIYKELSQCRETRKVTQGDI